MDSALFITSDLVIPPGELAWRFSRSSGPGGQGVNTTDSRVELSWNAVDSPTVAALPELRDKLLRNLSPRLVDGTLTIAASEYRAQLRNRTAARNRLARLLRDALVPPPARRRATRPSRGAVERRLHAKRARAQTKAGRSRIRRDFDS